MGVTVRERNGSKRYIATITVGENRHYRTFPFTTEGKEEAEAFIKEKTKVRKFKESFVATRLVCHKRKIIPGLYLAYRENKSTTSIVLTYFRRRPGDGKVINIRRKINSVDELNQKYQEIINVARGELGTTSDQMVDSRQIIKRFLWELESQYLGMKDGILEKDS